MISLYHVATPVEQNAPSGRSRPTGDLFWIWREMRRHEYMAEKWREAGHPGFADLCEGWAEQARLEIAALEASARRMAAYEAGRAAE